MRKTIIFLIFLLIFILPGCKTSKSYYQDIEPFDYDESAKTLIEINKNLGQKKYIEASIINQEMIKDTSISSKAKTLMTINKISSENDSNK